MELMLQYRFKPLKPPFHIRVDEEIPEKEKRPTKLIMVEKLYVVWSLLL